jgi:hypothetical protein
MKRACIHSKWWWWIPGIGFFFSNQMFDWVMDTCISVGDFRNRARVMTTLNMFHLVVIIVTFLKLSEL